LEADDNEVEGELHPDLLLVNAVAAQGSGRERLIELLLTSMAVPLDEVWPKNGEPALSMAVTLSDVQVRVLHTE
jgi:hypothetical protein